MMESGRLRHWLTFETKVVDQDSDGNVTEVWQDAFSTSARMPCEVVFLSGRELITAQAMHSKVTLRVKTRYRPGFEFVQRASSHTGQVFNIEAVIPDPDSGVRFVTLLCSTGVNEGG